jgi:hypothetical protein
MESHLWQNLQKLAFAYIIHTKSMSGHENTTTKTMMMMMMMMMTAEPNRVLIGLNLYLCGIRFQFGRKTKTIPWIKLQLECSLIFQFQFK